MSETKKEREITYIAYGIDKNLEARSAERRGLSEPNIPMEIPVSDGKVTNELGNGKTAIIGSDGKIIGYIEKDGTINRKLKAIDKKEKYR